MLKILIIPENVQRADQIILDYVFVISLKNEVDAILCRSCVTEAFQVIDDRRVLN